MPERISRLFARVLDLGLALGWRNISDEPGCKEHGIDEHWWFAVNPHGEPTRTSGGAMVPPHSIYIKFNGWPAGIVDSGGGLIAAGGLANEAALLAAIDKAIEKAREHEG